MRIISAGNITGSLASPVFKKGGVVFLLILLYVSALGKLDYVITSAAYLFITFLFLKAGKWYWLAVISVAAPWAIKMLFSQVFRIPMP